MLENPEVSEALKIVEIAAYTPAEMRVYDKFWDNVSVAKTLENARRRSEEKQKETELKFENTVKRMKAKGFSTEEIIDITGLKADEIERL